MPVRGCPTCGRARCQRHNSRKRAARRAYSDTAAYRAMRQAVIDTHGLTCHHCTGLIRAELPATHPDGLVLAHVIAHADGGPFELENLRPAHKWCNQQAGRHG